MPEVHFISGVIIAVGLVLAGARLAGLPPSPLLLVAGLTTALLNWPLPQVRANPEVMLGLLLPPLLYAGVVALSIDLLRHAPVRGLLAGAGLVFGITVLVAFAAHWLLPELDPVACLLLGICAAIADTRVPQETGQHRHLPRALTDAFAGQAVSARLVVVTLFMLARGAIGGPPPGAGEALLRLGIDLTGGGVLGAAIGLAMVAFRRRIEPATAEVAVSLATPFVASAAAEAVGVSPAVAIVATALTISFGMVDRHTGEAISSSEARLVSRHVWSEAEAMLSGALFFLIGRALPESLVGLGRFGWPRLALVAVVLLALVLALQFLLALLATAMPLTRRVPDKEGKAVPSLRVAVAASCSAHRSVIALALALAIPAQTSQGMPYPERDLVLALTALLVLVSGLLQAATLPAVLAWAQLGGEAERQHEVKLAQSQAAAAQERMRDHAGPEKAAAEGRRVLHALRGTDAIGDEALREADRAVALRAHAEQAPSKSD